MTLSYLASEHPTFSAKIMETKLTILKELLEEITSFSDMSESTQGKAISLTIVLLIVY